MLFGPEFKPWLDYQTFNNQITLSGIQIQLYIENKSAYFVKLPMLVYTFPNSLKIWNKKN